MDIVLMEASHGCFLVCRVSARLNQATWTIDFHLGIS